MGSLGVTFATLGYLFLVGRIMAGTLVLNAVLFEQLGSISELVFELPLIRRIPARFPKVAAFFDLPSAARRRYGRFGLRRVTLVLSPFLRDPRGIDASA